MLDHMWSRRHIVASSRHRVLERARAEESHFQRLKNSRALFFQRFVQGSIAFREVIASRS
jgi:hypothetical protein